jgi:hypothetical protein
MSTTLNDINNYKSDEYVNKVFKYFVLELIQDNSFLSDNEISVLKKKELKIQDSDIKLYPECVKNLYDSVMKYNNNYLFAYNSLYEDVMKYKNNYLFAYYLTRLYEHRINENKPHSAQKYFDFSEYIIGLDIDFETLNWSNYEKIKEENDDLYGIYGKKMHKITNEFLRNGNINEVIKNENINEVIQLYIYDYKFKLYNSVDSYIKSYEPLDEVNKWYYGNDETKKRKFHQIIFGIIDKYEKNKKQKIENKRYPNKKTKIFKLMMELLKFISIYLIIILSEPIVVPYLFNQEPFEETNFKNEGSYNMIVQLYNISRYQIGKTSTDIGFSKFI